MALPAAAACEYRGRCAVVARERRAGDDCGDRVRAQSTDEPPRPDAERLRMAPRLIPQHHFLSHLSFASEAQSLARKHVPNAQCSRDRAQQLSPDRCHITSSRILLQHGLDLSSSSRLTTCSVCRRCFGSDRGHKTAFSGFFSPTLCPPAKTRTASIRTLAAVPGNARPRLNSGRASRLRRSSQAPFVQLSLSSSDSECLSISLWSMMRCG